MFNFLKKKNKNENKEAEKNTELLSKTASLLIHAAKMDQKYSDEEKEIIKKTMIELGCEDDSIDEMLIIAEKNESDSNQILDFTREIKNTDDNFKTKFLLIGSLFLLNKIRKFISFSESWRSKSFFLIFLSFLSIV